MKNKKIKSFVSTKDVLKHFSIPDLIKISKFSQDNADLNHEEQMNLLRNIYPDLHEKLCKLMYSKT